MPVAMPGHPHPHPHPHPRHRDRGLEAIAAFKMLKAILLVAVGLGMLTLLRSDTASELREWLAELTVRRGQLLVQRGLDFLNVARPAQIGGLGLASIAYGLLFATEGVGLWLEKRWAEYLTVIATGSLIPFELWELWRRFTAVRVLALAANLAAVAYLVFRLRHPRSRLAATDTVSA
jgi:uncharacterized membrane protein (DUF2068 family)